MCSGLVSSYFCPSHLVSLNRYFVLFLLNFGPQSFFSVSFMPSNCLDTQKFLAIFSLLVSSIRELQDRFCVAEGSMHGSWQAASVECFLFSWLATFFMGSSPVPQIPWQHWGYVWHLYCLSSVQEGQGLWIWTPDSWVLLGEVSLLLSCWRSELERKRFLISKKAPMCENSSYCHKRKINSLSKTVSSFEKKNYSEQQSGKNGYILGSRLATGEQTKVYNHAWSSAFVTEYWWIHLFTQQPLLKVQSLQVLQRPLENPVKVIETESGALVWASSPI